MLCKVINTKSVFGGKADIQELVLANKGEPQFIYRIIGEITGYVEGDSKFKRIDRETGEVQDVRWTKFAGDFFAVNRKEQEFEAVICFLPEYIGGPLKEAIRAEPGASVQIGFDIYVTFNDQSATSYEFIAQPLRGQSAQSKIEAMRTEMPALPTAPKHKQIGKSK